MLTENNNNIQGRKPQASSDSFLKDMVTIGDGVESLGDFNASQSIVAPFDSFIRNNVYLTQTDPFGGQIYRYDSVIDNTGVIHVVWARTLEFDEMYTQYSSDNGVTWSVPYALSTLGVATDVFKFVEIQCDNQSPTQYITIACTTGANSHTVGSASEYLKVFWKQAGTGGAWTGTNVVTGTTNIFPAPVGGVSIAFTSTNHPRITYLRRTQSLQDYHLIVVAKASTVNGGGAWTSNVITSGPAYWSGPGQITGSYNTRLLIDSSDNLYTTTNRNSGVASPLTSTGCWLLSLTPSAAPTASTSVREIFSVASGIGTYSTNLGKASYINSTDSIYLTYAQTSDQKVKILELPTPYGTAAITITDLYTSSETLSLCTPTMFYDKVTNKIHSTFAIANENYPSSPILSISGTGTVTVVVNTPNLYRKGQYIMIAGTTNFNGNFKIDSVVDETTFKVLATGHVTSETTGTVEIKQNKLMYTNNVSGSWIVPQIISNANSGTIFNNAHLYNGVLFITATDSPTGPDLDNFSETSAFIYTRKFVPDSKRVFDITTAFSQAYQTLKKSEYTYGRQGTIKILPGSYYWNASNVAISHKVNLIGSGIGLTNIDVGYNDNWMIRFVREQIQDLDGGGSVQHINFNSMHSMPFIDEYKTAYPIVRLDFNTKNMTVSNCKFNTNGGTRPLDKDIEYLFTGNHIIENNISDTGITGFGGM